MQLFLQLPVITSENKISDNRKVHENNHNMDDINRGQNNILRFSIDHILNHAGNNDSQSHPLQSKYTQIDFSDGMRKFLTPSPPFDWLYYTRYHPPRLPRNNFRQQPAKRQPGRLPRVPFTPHQLNTLEEAYKKSMYLSSEEANQLAQKLDLSSMRVKIWFQNRRARDRREHRIEGHAATDQTPKTTRFEVGVQDLSLSYESSSS